MTTQEELHIRRGQRLHELLHDASQEFLRLGLATENYQELATRATRTEEHIDLLLALQALRLMSRAQGDDVG